MIPKRFIYSNGNLIPKKVDKSTQNEEITHEKENTSKFSHLSRNSYLTNPPKSVRKILLSDDTRIPSFQQEDEKIIYENNHINEESQTSNTYKVIKIINKFNENKTYDSNIEAYLKKEKETIKGKERDDFLLFNNKKTNMNKRNKKPTLYSQIEQICKHFYLNKIDTNKENIFNKMYKKENEFVKYLNKNVVNKDGLILRKKYSVRNLSKLTKYNFSDKINTFNNKVKNSRSYKSNKIIYEELIKKYNNNEKVNTIDINKGNKRNFEYYGINSYRYRHPQIYQLKSEEKVKLPDIMESKKKPVELVDIVPVKKENKKEEKLNEYIFYKVMKNHRLKKFHI